MQWKTVSVINNVNASKLLERANETKFIFLIKNCVKFANQKKEEIFLISLIGFKKKILGVIKNELMNLMLRYFTHKCKCRKDHKEIFFLEISIMNF